MTSAQVSQFYVKVGGSPLSQGAETSLEAVTIEQSLSLPSMCTIAIHDPSFEWANSATLQLGAEIEVSVAAAPEVVGSSGGDTKSVFKGEVVGIEPEAEEGGESRTTFRCYDRSHRMQRERISKAFLNVKVTDIVSTIAGAYSLSADVEATGQVYPHIYQDNLTDYEFLTQLARRVGYFVSVDKGKLHFKPGTLGSGLELTYKSNLLSFRPRMTLASQFKDVRVLGWDPAKQSAIIGNAVPQALPDHVKAKRGAVGAGTTFHQSFVASQADGDEFAKGIASEIELAALQGEGVALGDPAITPGSEVTIVGLGSRFRERYRVTKARHVVSAAAGYRTEFSITGHNTDTMADLILGGAARPTWQSPNGLTKGAAIGLVTNTDDPDKLGRVKLKFPMYSDDVESAWARVVAPSAGPESGFITIPEVGEEVLALFPGGDINYPVVIGSLWSEKNKIPASASAASQGEIPLKQVFRSRNGHEILVDDSAGDLISVTTHDGHTIVLDSANKKIEVKTAGGHQLVFDDNGGMVELTVSGGHSATFDAGGVVISSAGNLELTSSGNIKVDAGGQLELSAGGPVTVKGAVVNLN
jgi:phage protein D/phage baseplate assembly protein gpV